MVGKRYFDVSARGGRAIHGAAGRGSLQHHVVAEIARQLDAGRVKVGVVTWAAEATRDARWREGEGKGATGILAAFNAMGDSRRPAVLRRGVTSRWLLSRPPLGAAFARAELQSVERRWIASRWPRRGLSERNALGLALSSSHARDGCDCTAVATAGQPIAADEA